MDINGQWFEVEYVAMVGKEEIVFVPVIKSDMPLVFVNRG